MISISLHFYTAFIQRSFSKIQSLFKIIINFEVIFSATENSVLLATDVAARGLDVQNVEHVIHYQIPKTAEVLLLWL